ncbi:MULTISPECIES: DUF3987 domain-containing protein [Leptolyngbya]|uniref:DUF3987 domain-containing protein n=1 Tax=Leptolyngbya TaxID=47251 RepID=UPI001682CFEC|nr:DUF3987 domain-containing protein [Leptolyngbya sp. FACHB-1624]MBD1856591.1 DUF3987 domain-containing protein [Leptolyngbya sp. FACHB-1624]
MNTNSTLAQEQGSFDIRNFLDRLNPVKGKKDRYYCPVCNGNNLTINPNTGAYQCWNSCENHDIREAIAPWKDKQQEAKPVRPKASRAWTYTDVDGKPSIRTRRVDDGEGGRKIWQEYLVNGQWVAGSKLNDDAKEPLKKALALYRHQEIKAAIAEGKTIYFVEGEVCADAMWKLGLPATTSIGGSASLDKYGDYSELLKGASLVICPDRDQTGVKYAEAVEAMYPGAKWLYAFPESPLWKALPKDKGLDVADWIESGASVEQIVGAVEEKRNLGSKAKAQTATEVLSIEQVQAEVNDLCEQSLSKSDLTVKILSLAERSGRQANHVWSLYYACEEDASKAEEVSNVNELLELQQSTLKAKDILHPVLAELIEKTARAMPTSGAWLLSTLFPALGSMMGKGQRLVINPDSKYVVSPIFWVVIIAKSGRKKTPTQSAIINPLFEMQLKANKKFAKEKEAYQKACKQAAKGGSDEEITLPVKERFVVTGATPEGLKRAISESPNLLRYTDELKGMFSFDQYKKSGSEEEFYLSLFNGKPDFEERADADRCTATDYSCVGITGSIQWGVLERLQAKRGFNDENGLMSRFLFCCEDAPLGYITRGNGDNPVQQLEIVLEDLYGALRDMKEQDYLLSDQAWDLWEAWQHHLTKLINEEVHEGLELVYPKIETYTARFALLLHVVNATLDSKRPAPVVSAETMQKAILLGQYYLTQAKIVYGTNDPESEQDKLLTKILELGRKKGTLTAREASQGVRALRDQKYTPAQIRELFTRLVEMGHGTIEGDGGRMKWVYAAQKAEAPKSTKETKPEIKEAEHPYRRIIEKWVIDAGLTVDEARELRRKLFGEKWKRWKQYTPDQMEQLKKAIVEAGSQKRSQSATQEEGQVSGGYTLSPEQLAEIRAEAALHDRILPAVIETYRQECRESGKKPGKIDYHRSIVRNGFVQLAADGVNVQQVTYRYFEHPCRGVEVASMTDSDWKDLKSLNEELFPTSPELKKAREGTLEEYKEFQIGDRVEVTIEKLPSGQEPLINKDKIGAIGKVTGFEPGNQWFPEWLSIVVTMQDGSTERYTEFYLKKLEVTA